MPAIEPALAVLVGGVGGILAWDVWLIRNGYRSVSTFLGDSLAGRAFTLVASFAIDAHILLRPLRKDQ